MAIKVAGELLFSIFYWPALKAASDFLDTALHQEHRMTVFIFFTGIAYGIFKLAASSCAWPRGIKAGRYSGKTMIVSFISSVPATDA